MKFVVLGVAAVLCGLPSLAHAKAVTESKVTTVEFRSPVGDEVGYEFATVGVRHWFMECLGTIVLQVDLQRSSLHVGEWYRFERERHIVNHLPAPRVTSVSVDATVSGPGMSKALRLDIAEGTPQGCYGDTIHLGTVKQLVGEKAKPEDVREYLESLSVSFGKLGFLRNPEVESELRAQKRQKSVPKTSGGIVVSSSSDDDDDRSEDTSKTKSKSESESKSNSAPEPPKRTPTGFTNEQLQAWDHEAEGDRLAQLGPMFYPQALQQYQQAQALAPSASVQQKIDRIHAQVAAALIAGKAIEATGKATEQLVIAINAKTPIFKELEAGCRRAIDGDANACSLNFRYGRKVYVVAGAGRQDTQLLGSYYEDYEDQRVAARDVAWRTTYIEAGAGLALRFLRYFDFKLEGVMAPGWGSWQSERTSEEAGFEESPNFGVDWSYRLGLSVELPRTPLALTVFYKAMASRFDEEPEVGWYDRDSMRSRQLQINPGSISDLNYIGVGLVLRGRKQ